MKRRIAAWLRRLAQHIDGDAYVSRTGIYKGAIAFVDELNNEIQDHVTKAMVDGDGAGRPVGVKPEPACNCGARSFKSGNDPHMPMCPLYRPRTAHDFTDPHDMGEGR